MLLQVCLEANAGCGCCLASCVAHLACICITDAVRHCIEPVVRHWYACTYCSSTVYCKSLQSQTSVAEGHSSHSTQIQKQTVEAFSVKVSDAVSERSRHGDSQMHSGNDFMKLLHGKPLHFRPSSPLKFPV